MRKFLEEHGYLVVAVIVASIFLVIIKAVSVTPVADSEKRWVDDINTDCTNTIYAFNGGDVSEDIPKEPDEPETPEEPEEPDEPEVPEEDVVAKGTIIIIDSKKYRVLNIQGSKAKLLGLYDVTKMNYDVDNDEIVSFGNENAIQYADSDLDNYLEKIFYPSLSFKSAIIPQEIEQNKYYKIVIQPTSGTYYSCWEKENFLSTDTSGTPYWMVEDGTVSVGTRNVFAPDLKDVLEYLDYNITPQKLNTMFYDSDHSRDESYTPYYRIWLRSAYAYSTRSAVSIEADTGGLSLNTNTNNFSVRPAFYVDLKKCEWTEYVKPNKYVIEGTVARNNIVMIDGRQYRVLKVSGNQATLLGMFDATKIKFNATSKTTSFGGTTGQKYAGSDLDNYLENTYYPSLPFKDAVVAKTITQNMFKFYALPPIKTYYYAWYKDGFTSSTTKGTSYYITDGYDGVSVGSRHCYVLDLQDIFDYFAISYSEYDLIPQRINTLFYNVDSSISNTAWLRSVTSNSSKRPYVVMGADGSVYDSDVACTDTYSVRPSFVIDLTKFEYK